MFGIVINNNLIVIYIIDDILYIKVKEWIYIHIWNIFYISMYIHIPYVYDILCIICRYRIFHISYIISYRITYTYDIFPIWYSV